MIVQRDDSFAKLWSDGYSHIAFLRFDKTPTYATELAQIGHDYRTLIKKTQSQYVIIDLEATQCKNMISFRDWLIQIVEGSRRTSCVVFVCSQNLSVKEMLGKVLRKYDARRIQTSESIEKALIKINAIRSKLI